jgi:hemerythrin
MNPEDVEKYMDKIHPLPHVEYHKQDHKIIIPKEESDEKPEGDSSGHPGPDDA